MKKLTVLIVVALILSSLSVFAQTQQMIVRKGNDIVIYEIKERYSDVPISIPTDTALSIMRRGKGQFTLKGEKKYNYTLSFPITFPIKQEISSLDTVYYYQFNEIWVSTLEKNIKPIKNNWIMTTFWLIIPALGILIISLINQLIKQFDKRNKRIFIFYLSIVLSIAFSMLIGFLTHNESAGVFAEIIAGIFAGIFAGKFAGKFAGMFAGMFASIFANGFAGIFASVNQITFETGIHYLTFIICVCFISYIVSKIIRRIKK